ncbi:MAG: DNA-binding domain-containing protein [Gammaproteobacteria bacterium]
MQLQNLQSEFAELLLATTPTDELARPAENWFIHQQNMVLNLTLALQNTYPLVTQLVGKDFFKLSAKEYIKQYPCRTGNLNEYGEYFGKFLSEFAPVKELIYLAEVAEFEWACRLAYTAADAKPIDLKLLETITPYQYDKLYFIMHPASQLMKFYYPILQIIDACKGNTVEQIDVNAGGVYLLIIRRHLDICLAPLSVGDFTMLLAMQDGKSLAEALEMTLAVDKDFRLDEKLPNWVKNNTLVDYFLAEKVLV